VHARAIQEDRAAPCRLASRRLSGLHVTAGLDDSESEPVAPDGRRAGFLGRPCYRADAAGSDREAA
jgi:hypothetical protein